MPPTLARLLRGTRKHPTVSIPKGKPTICFNISDNIEKIARIQEASVLSDYDEEEVNRSLF